MRLDVSEMLTTSLYVYISIDYLFLVLIFFMSSIVISTANTFQQVLIIRDTIRNYC